MVVGIGLDLDFCFKLLVPFSDDGAEEQAFGKMRIHNWIHDQCEIIMGMGS